MADATTMWSPYCGAAPAPGEWLARWNGDPLLGLGFVLAVAMWSRWGDHEAKKSATGAGLTALFLFLSPFCVLGSALFTIRVVHDVILVALLAPLVMKAFALERRAVHGSLALYTAVHALVFLVWHAPPLYAAAMSYDAVFWAMQITITGTAAIWWAQVVRAPAAAAVGALLATMVAMGLLGALLTFARTALYAPHWLTTQAWGLSPLEDQQLAGVVMWAPASLIYLLAALKILYRSFSPEPAR
ncbi:cytochrome c oxidase assembly protein [Altererythrobacter sp. B11]|uniref:cytochrome c oxidase assembly protein n=1 Tax=Altererythrobacter sp. B11 TaxID=2060312 RepID=UPI001E5651A2|nr:cytochrome c oxidase assembly protein [Altererythrobacter sp. B11]